MSKTVDEDVVEKPSITETIAKLRELLKEWNHHTPKTDRDKMVGAFHVTITRLSEQAARFHSWLDGFILAVDPTFGQRSFGKVDVATKGLRYHRGV